MVHHPTNKCFVLKDKIQALVDAKVLTLKSEQKKVTANMVILEFGTIPKVTVPDGFPPIPKARLEINNPSAKQQDAKRLVPLTLKTRKSCGCTQTSPKTNNGIQRNPSQKGNPTTLSLFFQIMTK